MSDLTSIEIIERGGYPGQGQPHTFTESGQGLYCAECQRLEAHPVHRMGQRRHRFVISVDADRMLSQREVGQMLSLSLAAMPGGTVVGVTAIP